MTDEPEFPTGFTVTPDPDGPRIVIEDPGRPLSYSGAPELERVHADRSQESIVVVFVPHREIDVLLRKRAGRVDQRAGKVRRKR